MKEFEIKTTQCITQEQLDDVLTTAFEGGITYWCNEVKEAEWSTTSEPAQYLSEVLTRGGTLQLHDSSEYNPKTGCVSGKWYSLSIDMLLKAFEDKPFDFDNYDAGDADEIVQKAIFGEVIYG